MHLYRVQFLGTFFCIVILQTVRSLPQDCAILQPIIPQKCWCEGAVNRPNDIVINCKSRGLTSMPPINGTYNGTIYEFTLAINNIETLPSDAFQGLKIERLDITQNKLKNISTTAFRGLEDTLIVLKIGGNINPAIKAPFDAMTNLTNLQELTMNHFIVPTGDGHLENSSYFQPFSNLRVLSLDTWGLKSIGPFAFTGLTSLTKLHLTNNPYLTTYPVQAINSLMTTLEEIEITYTGLTNLTFYGFQPLKVLKTLILKYNKLKFFEEDSFKGLENTLEYLDLGFNAIGSQVDRLQVLQGLKTLKLQNTGVLLPEYPNFLKNKSKLVELNLASNNLVNIRNTTLRNLASLVTLDLSDNAISTMAENCLSGLTSLQKLLLDHQALVGKTLTLPSLTSLTSLVNLMLASTPLSTSSWDKITQASNLVTLNLRKTFAQGTIPDLTFQKMTRLVTLDLSENQITNISQRTFVGPTSTLKNIHLFSNKLNYFDSCTFHNYTFPIELDLSSNPLYCDCRLYWLRKAYGDNLIKLTTLEKCFYPPNLNGSDFTQTNLNAFCATPATPPTCGDYYSTTVTPVTSQTTITLPPIQMTVNFVGATSNSITVSWVINPLDELQSITVLHSKLQSSERPTRSRELPNTNSQYDVTGLLPNTAYEICVEGQRVTRGAVRKCVSHRTKPSGLEPSTTPSTGSGGTTDSVEIGIIIGAVIGGLVLFALLVAIIYFMFVRKKSPKDNYPVQPRTFTPAELPSIGYDSKRYRKKKKDETTDGNKNNVSVTVISDGQTPNVGRTSTGSYQYLHNDKPVSNEPNPSTSYVNDVAVSPYDNDMNLLRPLPEKPVDYAPFNGSYHNSGLHNSTGVSEPHTYSEINL